MSIKKTENFLIVIQKQKSLKIVLYIYQEKILGSQKTSFSLYFSVS